MATAQYRVAGTPQWTSVRTSVRADGSFRVVAPGSQDRFEVRWILNGRIDVTTTTSATYLGVVPLPTGSRVPACARFAPAPSTSSAAGSAVDPQFSIAVMPDTQQEVFGQDPRFLGRANWLVANAKALDLRFVLHTGDVVNWGWLDPHQYAMAGAGMVPLERAAIPYALTIGNHDTRAVGKGGSAYVKGADCVAILGEADCAASDFTHRLARETQEFNGTFTAARYGAVVGAFEAGKVDNIYSTFTAGGKKWLVLTLELWARTAVIDWAATVVKANPDFNVIIETHSYLEANLTIGQRNGGYGDNSPQTLFNRVVSQYPNVKMVFSGHAGIAGYRVDTGRFGNKIASFLQTFHSITTNPVRVMTINTVTGVIATRIYTPSLPLTGSLPQYDTTVSGMTFVG